MDSEKTKGMKKIEVKGQSKMFLKKDYMFKDMNKLANPEKVQDGLNDVAIEQKKKG